MIIFIAPITPASVSISTYMRRGSRSRFRPVSISGIISTLPSILISVLGTASRLGALPGATPIPPISISIPGSAVILVYITIPLTTIIPSVI